MSSLFCGIDVGTTNLKVLLLNGAGETEWVKSVPAPHLNDGLGIVTDARALLSHTEDLIIEGWKAVGRGRRIAAIASAGIGEDGVGITGNFQPLGHAIQWNDRRGEADALALSQTELAKSNPAILLDFSSSVGKWAWLRRHRPQELAGAAGWITMTDWPIASWAGVPFMSATLAPRTGAYDVFTRQWLDGFLRHCNAPPMPPLREAGAIVGKMRRGRLVESGAATSETLLVAGGHDHPMAASAIRRILKDARIDSLGTANATYGETASLRQGQDMEGLYVSLPISGSAGVATIGMVEFSVTLGKVVDDVGALYNVLLAAKTPGDIPASVRPVLHTMAQRTRHYWQAMTRVGVPEAPIYATGGWARSPALMQLRASVFEEPVTVVDEPELVALGAALFAAQGAGQQLSFSAARHSHVVEPT